MDDQNNCITNITDTQLNPDLSDSIFEGERPILPLIDWLNLPKCPECGFRDETQLYSDEFSKSPPKHHKSCIYRTEPISNDTTKCNSCENLLKKDY